MTANSQIPVSQQQQFRSVVQPTWQWVSTVQPPVTMPVGTNASDPNNGMIWVPTQESQVQAALNQGQGLNQNSFNSKGNMID
jgi:hypothetical protein